MVEEKEIVSTDIVSGHALPVMEAFYTVQGEGAYTGHASYFIRLAGCDVGCVWCDVKESWPVDAHPVISVEDIVKDALQYPARTVVITGGEPLMHDLTFLASQLKSVGFQIHIETSGAYPLSGSLDWVCLSPKKFKAPIPSILEAANELKVVIYNKSDFAWAEKYAGQMATGCTLFLQPEWGKRQAMMPLIVDYVKENPQWKISLQTHKYLEIP